MSVHVKPYQAAEDERAKTVLVFQPEDAVFVNCLHPAGSLYEQPISQISAAAQHRQYQKQLSDRGITVYNVPDVMMLDCDNQDVLGELREFAFSCLHYEVDPSYRMPSKLTEEQRYFTSDEYKRKVIVSLSKEELVRIILENPTVRLRLDSRNTGIEATKVEMRPSGNCVFTRD